MANLNPGGEKAALCLEDLRVGQRFLSGTHRIDEDQIRAFAEQFDPQPFHLDAEAAKATLFEGLVASGWHTAAITMRLLMESGLPIAGGMRASGGVSSRSAAHRAADPGAAASVARVARTGAEARSSEAMCIVSYAYKLKRILSCESHPSLHQAMPTQGTRQLLK